jgi:hypothetical protein
VGPLGFGMGKLAVWPVKAQSEALLSLPGVTVQQKVA